MKRRLSIKKMEGMKRPIAEKDKTGKDTKIEKR